MHNYYFLGEVFVLLLSTSAVAVASASASIAKIGSDAQDDDVLITDMVDWLKSNGAYINDKLQVRRVNPDDPSSPRGLFALESLDAGEIICNIPWDLMITPIESNSAKGASKQLDCGTIKAVIEELGKNESDMTPYAKYLQAQPRWYTLPFWSDEGQSLFWEMTNDERLPPVWIEDIIDDWVKECNGDTTNEDHLFAVMLVKTRADYQYLVPFYDMMNHNNGKVNVEHKYNPYEGDPIDETGYEIITSKTISAGEEVFNSYNQCKGVCKHYYDWFGTPEMFLHFGFVEGYPQRWLFDFARVKFDLDWKNGDEETGEVVVNFLVPPSKTGMDLLRKEIVRLEQFGKELKESSSVSVKVYNPREVNLKDVKQNELKSLREYYDALHDAIQYALDSNVTLVDDVWSMDEQWWVVGKRTEEIDDHCVRPSNPRGLVEEESSSEDEGNDEL